FYAERGLPPIFRLTPFSQPAGLDEALAGAGYTTLDRTLVMTSTLDLASNEIPASVRFTADAEWLDAFDRLRELEPDKRAHHRRIIEAAEGERLFALVEPNGAPIACGLGIIVDEMLGLFDLFTAEDHRHRGHGTAIVGGTLRRAVARDAQSAYLQVHSENLPAQRLYARFGFETAYRYWYRIGPQQQVG
ncbi:GNAT family N-acetyltransferase, partial [Candidatus Bipolaricaulota bacterium]|nr:GNAT family N-acetyltransferase [Candidatus Bipolaricaulota bacterium]